MSESKEDLAQQVADLQKALAVKQAFERGKRYGRIEEIGRVYETRIDCDIAPERVRQAA